jgi:hypothetical protein
MGVNRCDRPDALISDSDCDIVICFFGSPKHLFEDSIAVFGGFLVSLTKNLQDLEYLHLNPRRRHSVVVELLGQFVLYHLL